MNKELAEIGRTARARRRALDRLADERLAQLLADPQLPPELVVQAVALARAREPERANGHAGEPRGA